VVRPVALLTLALVTAAYVVIAYGQPFARYHYRALVYAVTEAPVYSRMPEGVFTTVNRTTFLIEGISPDRQHFNRVFVYVDEGKEGSTAITAREGRLIAGEREGAPVVWLLDGVRQHAATPTAARAGSTKVNVLRFDEIRTTLTESVLRPFRARGDDERELALIELWQKRDDPPQGTGPERMVSEFHARLVRVLSIFAMPLLAIPLALGRQRTQRSYGIAAGVALLVVYNELIEFGDRSASHGLIEPWLGLWLPFALFLGLSATLFVQAATAVGRPWTMRYGDRALGWLTALRRGRVSEPGTPQ